MAFLNLRMALSSVELADPLAKWLMPSAANRLSLSWPTHPFSKAMSKLYAFNRHPAAFTVYISLPTIMLIFYQRVPPLLSLYRGTSLASTDPAASF